MCASRSCFGALLIGALFSPGPGNAVEISGSIGAEVRGFSSAAQYPGQEDHLASIFAQPEFYFVSPDERRSFLFSPFLRVDAADSARTHFDVREAVFEYVGGNWEVRAGLAKVFWGVAESRHLVDVINQTDLVENLDGEAKLGQPLLSGSVIRDWGTVDLFLLPYFRTRTFPGTKGRLRSQFVVDDDTVRFDSRAGRHRVDWAIRYTHTLGSWDVGVSHFNGNSREPMLVPTLRPDGSCSLIAKYSVINQTGLDVQVTLGNWLWKFEGIHTSGNGRTFNGLVGGFEFTAVGIADTALDLGIIVEYLYDDRGKRAPHPFESDVFFGTRVAFNDEPSTELLAGLIRDLNGSATAFNVEANRRLGVSWTAEVELRAWAGVDSSDLQHALRRDDYVQPTLKRYF